MKVKKLNYTDLDHNVKYVYCRDCGGSYTTYDDLFDAYPEITKYKNHYAHRCLANDKMYKVLAIVRHEDLYCNVFVLESLTSKDVYLCTDDTRYLAPISVDAPIVTAKTKERIRKAIKHVESEYFFSEIHHSYIMNKTLCLVIYNSSGLRTYRYIPYVAKISTKALIRRITNYLREVY